MNTDYLMESRLQDSIYVAKKFDTLHRDAIEVKDAFGMLVGRVYLEDFCNMREVNVVTDENEAPIASNEDEVKLLLRLERLSIEEINYIRCEIEHKIGSRFVCCCDCNKTAQAIIRKIFGNAHKDLKYAESIFSLQDGDKVLFLSFNRIKLYRKAFVGKISSMLALNNVIRDCENRSVFYSKYKDLMDAFSSIGVACFYGIIPEADQLSCLSNFAGQRVSGYGKADYDFCKELLGGSNSFDYIACMCQNKLSRVVDKGIFNALEDCRGDFYNVIGGMRVTEGQPKEFIHTAYMFGPCTARGAMVSDGNTVASILQKKLNMAGGGWMVMNCGVGGGSDLENSYRYALSLPLKAGDAVLFLESGSFLDESDIDGHTIFRLSADFNARNLKSEWFLDRPAHCNAAANEVIAESFCKRICEKNLVEPGNVNSCVLDRFRSDRKIFSDSKELKCYIDNLVAHKFKTRPDESAGAILMHCNPMTLGHKFLIREALKTVDYLYVFLLSIDQSEIPYSLRREMLLHETQEFKNVRVFDCGEFLGSPKVFPDYFTKDSAKHSRIDATKEVLVFCQYIAPALGITKRFVGTENRDFVTRQYNNQLKLILPMYGIELKEVDRVSTDGKAVSAFVTRQLIHEGKWEDAARLVSSYSFSLLYEYYNSKEKDA